MMHRMRFGRLISLFVVAFLLSISGCGEKPAAPKTDLSEQDKQQIRELNEQRAQEWGTTKRK
jgi:predicted small lipoprotein YifL